MTNLVSVTTVLKPYSNFSMISPEVLELASERGSLVHSLLARYATGLMIFPEEVTPEVAGYYQSGQRWLDKFVVAVHEVEVEWVHPLHKYMGHPDIVCSLNGGQGKSLIDWKSGAIILPTWPVQVAAYRELAEKNGHQIARVGCVRIKKDGKVPKLDEFTGTMAADYAVFLCVLTCWKRLVKDD